MFFMEQTRKRRGDLQASAAHGEGVQSRASARISDALRQVIDLSHRFEEVLQRSLNVNATDLVAMEHLIRDRELSPGELSRRLRVSSAASTQVVDRLVAQGHAERHPHPTDRRRVVVRPADASVVKAMSELAPMLVGLSGVIGELDDAASATVAAFLDRVIEVYSHSIASGDASHSLVSLRDERVQRDA